jgi:iron complex outermembrane receptor protein
MIKVAILGAVSTAALTISLTPAMAQQAPAAADQDQPAQARPQAASTTPGDATDQSGEIVVTGIRASLATAQRIKRNSDAVVDSIVAEDIGKLPDNTVSDALQRVTGVQVQHAAGETQNVLIRGLPDIESFINGREIFTGTGRGVALQDIPSELVAGVDVYKTSTPEMIEGGVAGRIDIRLRRPFDFSGLEVAGTARAIYSDQSRKWSYIGSGVFSDRWQTAGGSEFGILIGLSYNRRRYEDQTAFNFGFNNFSNAATGGTNVLIPDTVGGLITDGDRKRLGANVSLEWKPNSNLLFYVDGLFTGYREDHDVDFFVGIPKAGNVVSVTPQTGSSVSPAVGQPAVPVAQTITTRDNFTITSKQTFHSKTDGYQVAAGTQLTLGRTLLSTEVTYNDSKVLNRAYILDANFVVPVINYNFNNNRTPFVDARTASGAPFNFGDTTILDIFQLFDQRNEADSKQIAWRGDLRYDVGGGFLDNLKLGLRYAHRTGHSEATNGAAYFIGTSGDPFPALGTNAPSDLLDGDLGIGRFALPDTGFIRSNIDQLRALAHRPAGPPALDPSLTFDLRESVFAGYAQLSYKFDVGAMPVEGVVGARVVNTDTRLNAILVSAGILSPIAGKRNELNVLPSITIKAIPAENLVIRALAGKSITRPQFGQLNPATSIVPLGVTGGTATFGTGSGGNPNLRSVKSDNFDASIEYYFGRTSSVSLAGFYRHLDGYIQTYSAIEIFPGPLGEPENFLVARPRNTGKGSLKGIEAAYQQFFDFLPGPLSGFGVQANFTLSDGHVPSPPNAAGISTSQQITPVSKYSYNVVAMYEKYGISARLAYNWRSKYIDSFSSVVPGGRIVVSPVSFLDFSVSYDLTKQITLTADATNLLDERYHDSFGTSGFTPRDTRQYDRTFAAGVRVRF